MHPPTILLSLHVLGCGCHRDVEDAEQIAAGQYETTGNWSYAQILDHLAKNMNFSIDGYPRLAPWPIRVVAGALKKKSALTETPKPGFKLPKGASAVLPRDDVAVETVLAEFKAAIERLENESATASHPLYGKFTH